MAVDRQSSTLPSAQPSYVLRGHTSQIHSVHFVRQNTRLLTGDGDGWIVYWKVETKRALAVWKAHDAAILGTAEWGRNKIITHGRDNTLRIWQLRPSDESVLSTILPAEEPAIERPKPWLLHTLPVNTLNFCAFSMCKLQTGETGEQLASGSSKQISDSILVAVPARDDKKIEVYQFPEERLRYAVPRVQPTDTGMVMAVKLVLHIPSGNTLVLAGYEGGVTAVHRLPHQGGSTLATAELVYLSQPHSQPVLSLDVSPDTKTYFTSSADAVIAAHCIPDLHPLNASAKPVDNATSKNSRDTIQDTDQNHQDISAANALVARPAQDAEPAQPTSSIPASEHSRDHNPLASPSSSLSFAKQIISPPSNPPSKPAGLSSLLSSATPFAKINLPQQPLPPITIQPAHKTINTKHSGQQSLVVRSDGRLLVTGGWDSRIRIYSTKTLKEVAVLKWHKEGVYAVDFGAVLEATDLRRHDEDETQDSGETQVSRRETGLGKLQRQREEQMQLKHWVVAGAKDGKVSLWEVF